MLGNYYLFTKTLCTCCGFVGFSSIFECLCNCCCAKQKQSSSSCLSCFTSCLPSCRCCNCFSCCPSWATCFENKNRSQHLFQIKERSVNKDGAISSKQLQQIPSANKDVGDLILNEQIPVCCTFQFCCCSTLYYQLSGFSAKTLTPCCRLPCCLNYPVQNGEAKIGQIVPKLSFLPYCCSYLSLQNQENIETYTIQRKGYNFCRKTWSIKKQKEIVAYLRDVGCFMPQIEVDLPESSSQNQKLVIMSTIPFLP